MFNCSHRVRLRPCGILGAVLYNGALLGFGTLVKVLVNESTSRQLLTDLHARAYFRSVVGHLAVTVHLVIGSDLLYWPSTWKI